MGKALAFYIMEKANHIVNLLCKISLIDYTLMVWIRLIVCHSIYTLY